MLYFNKASFVFDYTPAKYTYLSTPSPYASCDTRLMFWVEFYRFEFRIFILQGWLPNQVASAVWRKHSWDAYFLQGYEYNVECKEPCSGFELGSLCPFHTKISITLQSTPLLLIICYFFFFFFKISFFLRWIWLIDFNSISTRLGLFSA